MVHILIHFSRHYKTNNRDREKERDWVISKLSIAVWDKSRPITASLSGLLKKNAALDFSSYHHDDVITNLR